MSEDIEINIVTEEPERLSPDAVIPKEKLLEYTEEWKQKILLEMTMYEGGKAKIYAAYKKQKDMYDKWLSTKTKKMKWYDAQISGRKKVLMEVEKEIKKLENAIKEEATQIGTPNENEKQEPAAS